LNRLVIGLNRVFVGALTEDKSKIFLATSGTTSQERVCDLLIHDLSHNPTEGAGLSIEARKGLETEFLVPYIAVSFRGKELAHFRLSLQRYEFLRRVSEGVLPASFSPELYEDTLAFKSQLIRKLEEEIDLHDLPMKVITVEADGSVRPHTVEVVGDESGARRF